MRLLNKMERKFGRYAIPNLMKYIVILYVLGLLIGSFMPELIVWLVLDFDKVAQGQIWRLVTFLIPYATIRDIIYVFFRAYIFYLIGNTLERSWGSFRLNFYFFSGILYNIIAALLIYLFMGSAGNSIILILSFQLPTLDLLYTSLFFAFAAMYPDVEFMIYFLIPVKVKWLALISGAYYLYYTYQFIRGGLYLGVLFIVASLLNFIVFYFATRNLQRISPRQLQRRARYRKQIHEGMRSGHQTNANGRNVITKHKCAVCGRTEQDDDDLEFRFCSKCDGNYEYCMEHLFTHEHVKK